MKASDFDEKFETGEDITDLLDLAKSRRPSLEQKRVNVDFPEWMVEALEKEAPRLDPAVKPQDDGVVGNLSHLIDDRP